MDRNALVVNGLTKRYQDFTLDGVSFTVPQGSIVGLIGENGAGKSTTLHAVLGLIGRDGGAVELLGLPDTALDDGVRNQIGVLSRDAHPPKTGPGDGEDLPHLGP